MSDPALDLFAPAKVNLTLHVTGRREDGYHLLESLVVFAGAGDRLRLWPAEELTLSLAGPQADKLRGEDPADNLVLKAARALAAWAGIPPRARIELHKHLPVASGIGGGSADAAAALTGLARLWKLDVPAAEMHKIGLSLGADIPVCLAGRPMRMEGVGDGLTPAPVLPPAWLVLVNPGIALSTPAVFRARSGDFLPADPLTESPADARALAEALSRRRNDLTDAAISLAPVIADCLSALDAQPGCLIARMSGSGATCFGLFGAEEEARSAARILGLTRPQWWLSACPLLPAEKS
ncbi:4-(cytidine 5'-diphospho)-2-C-methyl-D-erythritol kinase [Telmatospirillum sp. J64-1]|uniref:4-(cytidine 5'-diphospho)-2-C-methyl-D-erythritol kinase n=1 Tax=Telmatospirillum sp. J64-1 TaxID=2502183 RepID=UPI00115CB61D|nr:4-(cytidine 5'-diphospho)-2-C-methyl-D-erythritol kinase [Telmatospirillum sp. J64-1]